MPSPTPQYQTRELSERTWPDFERLFSGGHGWDFCACMAFQRAPHRSRQEFPSRAQVGVANRQDKHALVKEGRAHGILVYADDEPIGWCEYGPSDELRGRANVEPVADSNARVWLVPCFVVERTHRRKGVATLALRAALDSIKEQGGGLVEAYPVASWTHGPNGSRDAVYVHNVGPVAPEWGGFGNVSTSGTVSMFEKAGFEAVAVCGGDRSRRVRSLGATGCHVLMRKSV